jgi:hypothetical protein
MQMDTGKIMVVQLAEDGNRSARIDCPAALIPNPGQYLLACEADVPDSVLGWPLFPVDLHQPLDESAVPHLGPIPASWRPGTQLHLRGPLGCGFSIPPTIRRLALAALGDTACRLLPLVNPVLKSGTDIAIFSTSPLPPLPPAIEIHALSALAENLAWSDFLVFEIPLEKLSTLRETLRLDPHESLPCQAQALIATPMPCAGIGDCGTCAVPIRQGGYELVCKDGPVFDLMALDW